MRYVAFIHGGDGPGFGISFPDCVSDGDTVEETIQRGAAALAFHVEVCSILTERNIALPSHSRQPFPHGTSVRVVDRRRSKTIGTSGQSRRPGWIPSS